MEVEENEEIIIDENEGDESRKKMITLANIIINLPRYIDPQKKYLNPSVNTSSPSNYNLSAV